MLCAVNSAITLKPLSVLKSELDNTRNGTESNSNPLCLYGHSEPVKPSRHQETAPFCQYIFPFRDKLLSKTHTRSGKKELHILH